MCVFLTMHLISDFSLWFLIPIALTALILTYFYYKKEGWFADLKAFYQNTLRILRFCSLFLIGLLLLGLILQTINYRDEKPVFINLIDNSNSMMNFKDSNLVKSQIASFRSKLKDKYGERFEFWNECLKSKIRF